MCVCVFIPAHVLFLFIWRFRFLLLDNHYRFLIPDTDREHKSTNAGYNDANYCVV